MFQPFIFKLDHNEFDISDNNLITSTNINIPLISLGYHYFFNRTKNAMSITKNLPNKFYNIVNPFEITIQNYDDSITNLTKHYINKTISSKTFYKIWEILFSFNIAEDENLNYAVIADESDVIVDTVKNYRHKLGDKKMKDTDYTLSKHTKELTLKQINKDLEKIKKIELLIADCTLKWSDDNFQEQEGYKLIIGQIIVALKSESKNFVLKFFESFTMPTIKLIYILSNCYEETYIYKPFFSKITNSERYVVCKKFKKSKLLKSLESVFDKMNTDKFIFDFFPDLVIPPNFLNKFKIINIKISNPQQIMCNEIVKYIKENNYFGEKYHTFRDKQIEATKWWVSNYFPPSSNLYEKNKEEIHKQLKSTEEKNNLIQI